MVKEAMTEKNTKTTEYKYLKLNELQANTTVNVFGVVKFARPPTKTRGSGKWRFFCWWNVFLCNIHVMPNNSIIGFIIIILVIGWNIFKFDRIRGHLTLLARCYVEVHLYLYNVYALISKSYFVLWTKINVH